MQGLVAVQVPAESLRYVESQPWPFPRSLMIAYRGKIESYNPSGETADVAQARVVLQSREAREAAADSGITQQEIQECAVSTELRHTGPKWTSRVAF